MDGFVESIDIPIERDDCLLLFSDGVTEACSDRGELFGQDRLTDAFARFAPLGTRVGLQKLQGEINRYQKCQEDDITAIMMQRMEPA